MEKVMLQFTLETCEGISQVLESRNIPDKAQCVQVQVVQGDLGDVCWVGGDGRGECW